MPAPTAASTSANLFEEGYYCDSMQDTNVTAEDEEGDKMQDYHHQSHRGSRGSNTGAVVCSTRMWMRVWMYGLLMWMYMVHKHADRPCISLWDTISSSFRYQHILHRRVKSLLYCQFSFSLSQMCPFASGVLLFKWNLFYFLNQIQLQNLNKIKKITENKRTNCIRI